VLESGPHLLHNPFAFVEMRAVRPHQRGAGRGREDLRVGDRDVDGVTSTALLVESLNRTGRRGEWGVPLGDESYGCAPTRSTHPRLGAKLLITVDCGVSSISEISAAATAGIDTIVVDHHLPHGEVPVVRAMLNRECEDSGYPSRTCPPEPSRQSSPGRCGSPGWISTDAPWCCWTCGPVNEATRWTPWRLVNLSRTSASRNPRPRLAGAEAPRLAAFASGCELVVYDRDQVARHLRAAWRPRRPFPPTTWRRRWPSTRRSSPGRAAPDQGRPKDAGRNRGDRGASRALRRDGLAAVGLLDELDRRLDLGRLSTLADNMPLRGEKPGARQAAARRLARTDRAGLREMLFQKGCTAAR